VNQPQLPAAGSPDGIAESSPTPPNRGTRSKWGRASIVDQLQANCGFKTVMFPFSGWSRVVADSKDFVMCSLSQEIWCYVRSKNRVDILGC